MFQYYTQELYYRIIYAGLSIILTTLYIILNFPSFIIFNLPYFIPNLFDYLKYMIIFSFIYSLYFNLPIILYHLYCYSISAIYKSTQRIIRLLLNYVLIIWLGILKLSELIVINVSIFLLQLSDFIWSPSPWSLPILHIKIYILLYVMCLLPILFNITSFRKIFESYRLMIYFIILLIYIMISPPDLILTMIFIMIFIMFIEICLFVYYWMLITWNEKNKEGKIVSDRRKIEDNATIRCIKF